MRLDALPPAQVVDVTSQRKPSGTMRIFSSGVSLRRVADLARRTNDFGLLATRFCSYGCI